MTYYQPNWDAGANNGKSKPSLREHRRSYSSARLQQAAVILVGTAHGISPYLETKGLGGKLEPLLQR